jgi:hypothetical protein
MKIDLGAGGGILYWGREGEPGSSISELIADEEKILYGFTSKKEFVEGRVKEEPNNAYFKKKHSELSHIVSSLGKRIEELREHEQMVRGLFNERKEIREVCD